MKRRDNLKKLAIKFHDNDFYDCFISLLYSLNKSYELNNYLTKDKNELCYIINNLLPIMYLTTQNSWEYHGLENSDGLETDTNEHFIYMKSYLQITINNLYVNEEVDGFLNDKNEFWNHETFILDLTEENDYERVYSK